MKTVLIAGSVIIGILFVALFAIFVDTVILYYGWNALAHYFKFKVITWPIAIWLSIALDILWRLIKGNHGA